ncbi:hypothetical protein CK203_079891 [Vitis vinifera]|uniref:Uncharacterized protein n=1 Tax=Vitis vinifera TaxID=29760 RepID=A0A438DHU6_VITVI|nr:hypothetical protein CK203_079891 [Vitis vinifera]
MVLATISRNIMDMSLMDVDTIARGVMAYEPPKIAEHLKPSKYFMCKTNLIQRWSVVLSTPQKDFLDKEEGDDLVDNSIEHHPFIRTLLEVEAFDAMDDSNAICIRGD